MTPTDKSSEEYVVPLGSTASAYDIAIEAFHFLDHFVIWREDIQEYVLNGSPEQVEIALRKLLKQNSNAFDKGVSDGSD